MTMILFSYQKFRIAIMTNNYKRDTQIIIMEHALNMEKVCHPQLMIVMDVYAQAHTKK